MHLTARDVDVD